MKHSLAFLCFCLPLAGLAQTLNQESPFRARNTIYLEGLGSGGFYSVNYERLLLSGEKQAYGFRIGTSSFGKSFGTITLIGELFTLIGRGSHHGDFGIGLTAANQKEFVFGNSNPVSRNTTLYAIPRISYRYQKPTGGLMVRAGFTPIAKMTNRADSTSRFGLWFGLSIGHSF